MGKLITIIGPSGVGKTTLVDALAQAGDFATAFEQHAERPFQVLYERDARYGLANQIDYLLLRAEQERQLREAPRTALMDGGLDLDFHGFTRVFHSRGLLSDLEFDLCRRLYQTLRSFLPLPDFIIRLHASQEAIADRLSARDRINIASAQDAALFDSYLDEWLTTIPGGQILELDVSHEPPGYPESTTRILAMLSQGPK